MKFTDLETSLGIKGDTLTKKQINISTNSLTKNINDVLKYCYNDTSIVISSATLTSHDVDSNTIVISGISNFLNVKNLNTQATFTLDNKGLVQILVKYTLIEGEPQTNSWSFSTSFPKLPQVPDGESPAYFDRKTGSIEQTLVSPITQLWLSDAAYVVSSVAQQDPEFDVPLEWGINFTSYVKPQGLLGLVESVFKHSDKLKVYGTIRVPITSDSAKKLASLYPSSLEKFTYPWDIVDQFDTGLPGILLKVDLNIDYNIAKNKIEFAAEQLLLYTPYDDSWTMAETNPQFIPTQAYTGKIALTGTDVEVDMLAPVHPGHKELALLANFEGFSLANLANLTGLTGTTKDPLKSLPKDIQNMANKLSDLQLTHAAIYIDYLSIEDVTVSYVSFTVGMPNLNWSIWKRAIVIDNIFCQFEIYYPFSKAASLNEREAIVTVLGKAEIEGVPFEVLASDQNGFVVNVNMEQQQTIPLNTIMKKYAPGIPAPGELTIDSFKMSVSPNVGYSMALAMASHPHPWVIPVGPHNISVDDVSIGFTLPKFGGKLTGTIAGEIEFGDFATLDVIYDIPGDIQIRSLLPEIRLEQIIDTLTSQHVPMPKAFDLTFKDNSIMFQKQGSNYVFQLMTELEGFGYLGLQVQKVGTKWGIAFGLDLLNGKPSQLPSVSILSLFENAFTLNKLMLVVSSFPAPQFTFPDLSAITNPVLNTKKVTIPRHGSELVAGFNFYAQWTLNTKDKQHQLLKKFLGLDPVLGITLQVGEVPEEFSRLFVDFNTKIQGHPFECQFGGQIEGGEVGVFLTGSFTVNIQKQPQTFDVVLLFVENGAFISADMTGPTAVKFGSLQLEDLALEIGIDWEGIPSLGVAATLAVKNFESSIAVFFDSADPMKSLVAGAVSDLTLKDVVDTLVGKAIASPIDPVLSQVSIKGTHAFQIPGSLASDLDHLKFDAVSEAFSQNGSVSIPANMSQLHLIVATKGSAWFITDLTTMRHYQLKKQGNKINVSVEAQLYCAPQNTSIGATRFPQGFYLNAALSFLGFDADATVDISMNRGIAIDAEMDKVVIGSEMLFCIKAAKGSGGPKISVSTYRQPKQPVKEFRAPHFYINGGLEMLGIRENIFIELTSKGFEFDLNGGFIPGLTFDLHGSFAGPQHLSVGGGIKAGLGTINLGALGKIKIDTDIDAELDVQVHGKTITASVQANFEALGKKHHIGKFDLNVKEAAFTKLAKTLENKATSLISSAAKDMLKDVEKAQKKVDSLNKQIKDMRAKVKKEHAASAKKFNDAKKKVDAAQRKVDSLNKQIRSAQHKIKSLKAAIKKKKSWAKHGNIFQKAKRGIEYTGYAAEKGTEIAGLYTEIGSLTAAKKTADGALTVAKQPLIGLKKAAQVVPVDMDPRVAGLIAAKETADGALEAAKLPLKGLSGI